MIYTAKYRYGTRLETDYLRGGEFRAELARTGEGSSLALVKYTPRPEQEFETVPYVTYGGREVFPLWEDEITSQVRFAREVDTDDEEPRPRTILKEVDRFLGSCVDLDERHRFLLSCFVLSTWVIDYLPVVPYVALIGLPQSGKTTALTALHLVCRRGLIAHDACSTAVRRACDHLMPTLFFDEAATAGPRQKIFHLLRSGTTRDAAGFKEGRSYGTYGAKVVTWIDVPEDEALNSRCITIPMRETSRIDLQRISDSRVISRADALQATLLRYRLDRHLQLPNVPGTERLRPRERDLYEALARPLGGDFQLCEHLLGCFKEQQDLNREPLPPNQVAVLESFFIRSHAQPDQQGHALRLLTEGANERLRTMGERFRLSEKAVSYTLKTFGFVNRKRTKTGWVVLADRAGQKRIHDLLWSYGISVLPESATPETPHEQCEFCKDLGSGDAAESFDQGSDDQRGFFDSEAWYEEEEFLRAKRSLDEDQRFFRDQQLRDAWEASSNQSLSPPDTGFGGKGTGQTKVGAAPPPHRRDSQELDEAEAPAAAMPAPDSCGVNAPPAEARSDSHPGALGQSIDDSSRPRARGACKPSELAEESRGYRWEVFFPPPEPSSWFPMEPGDDDLARRSRLSAERECEKRLQEEVPVPTLTPGSRRAETVHRGKRRKRKRRRQA